MNERAALLDRITLARNAEEACAAAARFLAREAPLDLQMRWAVEALQRLSSACAWHEEDTQ